MACAAMWVGGAGTPAPAAPPARLVVTGAYRYVRNPMYVALVVAACGQALLFWRTDVLAWAGIFWLGSFVFVMAYEEPALRRKFGAEYRDYCAHVPRWVPRRRAWVPGAG